MQLVWPQLLQVQHMMGVFAHAILKYQTDGRVFNILSLSSFTSSRQQQPVLVHPLLSISAIVAIRLDAR
jgi:hypothetical protein